MQIGDFIPVATVGSILPDGMEIAQRKLRGELSNGMCCSASEIGLGDDSDGIMILSENDPDSEWDIGSSVSDSLGLESDILWDLEVNANRPDAMSISGVARDLAASLGLPFKADTTARRLHDTCQDCISLKGAIHSGVRPTPPENYLDII